MSKNEQTPPTPLPKKASILLVDDDQIILDSLADSWSWKATT